MEKEKLVIGEGNPFGFEEEQPFGFEKEISVLYALGLEDYEVEYLIYMKTKQEISEKWKSK